MKKTGTSQVPVCRTGGISQFEIFLLLFIEPESLNFGATN
jgi:hypothetical protein